MAKSTLNELARSSGISAATLSRVLNHPEQVRPGLRKRAEEVLAQADYVPHGAARSLASRRSRTIGAIVPTVDSGLFAKIVDGMQQFLYERGYQLLLAASGYSPMREAAEVRALLERGVDAVMLVGRVRDEHVYELLRSRNAPFVTTCHYEGALPWPTVGWSNPKEAQRMADYLLDIGHQSFGVISGFTQDNDRAADRVAGFRNALAARGLDLPDACVLERSYTVPDARAAMATLLRMPRRPTAVMCGNDILAYGALQECLWRNMHVPQEISITGFDNIEMAAHCRPGITTMDVPARAVGQRAASILLDILDSGDLQAPQNDCIELELIVRGTTAPPQDSNAAPVRAAATSSLTA